LVPFRFDIEGQVPLTVGSMVGFVPPPPLVSVPLELPLLLLVLLPEPPLLDDVPEELAPLDVSSPDEPPPLDVSSPELPPLLEPLFPELAPDEPPPFEPPELPERPPPPSEDDPQAVANTGMVSARKSDEVRRSWRTSTSFWSEDQVPWTLRPPPAHRQDRLPSRRANNP
jgi:hypothetical protein